MDQLEKDILDTIKAHADPGITITPETELSELGIRSLELTEIIFDLEEAHGIEIEMNTAKPGASSGRSTTSSKQCAA